MPYYLPSQTTSCHSFSALTSITQYHFPRADILSFVLRPENVISKKESQEQPVFIYIYIYMHSYFNITLPKIELSIPLHSFSNFLAFFPRLPCHHPSSFSFFTLDSFSFPRFRLYLLQEHKCKYEI